MLLQRARRGAELGRGDRSRARARRGIAGEELDVALEAIGEFAELKSPWTMGHVHAVSGARRPRPRTSSACRTATSRRSAPGSMVYDLGRLGVSEHGVGQAAGR